MSFFFDNPAGIIRTLVVGVLAYLALVVILRVSGKRTLSKFNAFDLVVTVALGSTLATVLLSRDVPLLDGIFAFVVLVTMQYLVTTSSLRWRMVARITKSEPRALVYRGVVLNEALRAERMLEDELRAALRAAGFAQFQDVGLAVLETDGTVSAVGPLPTPPGMATSVTEGVAGAGEPQPDRQVTER